MSDNSIDLYRTKWALAFVCFSFFLMSSFCFLATCARLSRTHSAFEFTLNSSIVSYCIVAVIICYRN